MKLKFDFVTNSSSSVFIVAWPTKIKNLADVSKYISKQDKAEQIFKDLDNQQATRKIDPHNIAVINHVAGELESGYLQDLGLNHKINIRMFDNYTAFKNDFMKRHSITKEDLDFSNYSTSLLWKEYHDYRMKIATKLAEEFCKKNEGNYLYFFSYADEDGDFMSDMEHGGTFQNVPHIQISHH